MESHWGKDSCGANDQEIKLILQSLIEDLNLLKNDNFAENEHKELDLKYGKLNFTREKHTNGTTTLQLKGEKETDENSLKI